MRPSVVLVTNLTRAANRPEVLKMSAETSGLEKLDALLADLLADWNIYSTLIAGAIAVLAGYSLLLSFREPDVHPYLLARQATEAPVRQPGESAALRNLETPHGFPLRTGLNVKDPDAPKWTGGRNGDLRDIWRAAVRGSVGDNDTAAGKRGKIYTVLGKNLEEHDLDDITQEINIIGKHINESQANKVVVALSDSVELLAAIFGEISTRNRQTFSNAERQLALSTTSML